MKASVVDSFKLLFSDEYKVSDRDYKVLSDTLVSKGVSEEDIDAGVASLVNVLLYNKIDFPMTLKYFKYVWENTYVSFKFLDVLANLVKLGYIKIVKVSKSNDILGSVLSNDGFDVDMDGKVLIVQGTEKLTEVTNIFKDFINDKKRINEELLREINEATSLYPSYVKDFVTKLTTRYLKEYHIKVDVESYVDEDTTESLSLIFKDTSNYTLKDKDIKKIADKYIKKVNIVNDLDAYKESDDELYLGLELEKSKDLKVLFDPIYKFIGDLEVNGVQ